MGQRSFGLPANPKNEEQRTRRDAATPDPLRVLAFMIDPPFQCCKPRSRSVVRAHWRSLEKRKTIYPMNSAGDYPDSEAVEQWLQVKMRLEQGRLDAQSLPLSWRYPLDKESSREPTAQCPYTLDFPIRIAGRDSDTTTAR